MKNTFFIAFVSYLPFANDLQNTGVTMNVNEKSCVTQSSAAGVSPGKNLPLTEINAKAFGFLPSASAAKNTQALQQISAAINAASGGIKLVINKGLYKVGGEKAADAISKGYAFLGQSLLKLTDCTKPVIIEGCGATLRFTEGLHFGSFQKKTGAVYNAAPGGFYDHEFIAYPQCMIQLERNNSVTIRNLNLHGNLQNFTVGGYWGDTGIQLPPDGILAEDNKELTVDGVTSNYFPRDGIQIANNTPDEKAGIKKVSLLNCTFDGNARQGLSWVGGNHLYAENCRFINTGKTVNKAKKAALISAPGAGVDMEAERGLIRNGLFKNCLIDNNAGAGFLTVGDVAFITFEGGKIVGATNWSIYGSGPKAVFQAVTIVGSPVNLRIGTGPSDSSNTRFNNCLITMDSTLSPTGKVYGNYVMDFGGGAGGFFTRCTVDSKNRGTVYGGNGCVFIDCIFKQSPAAPGYNGYPFLHSNFYGTNRWYRPGPGVMPANLEISNFYGPFYINDVEVTGIGKRNKP